MDFPVSGLGKVQRTINTLSKAIGALGAQDQKEANFVQWVASDWLI